VINLANALNTVVGFQRKPTKSFNTLVNITFRLYLEGIQLLQKAEFHEHSLGPIPSWRSIKIGAKLPASIVAPIYRLRTERVGPNSMAQDILGGKDTTELETLNGYMLNLARKTGFSTPINETIYQAAKERFKPGFKPISEEKLLEMIKVKIKQASSETGTKILYC
jgi:ketopantoate reductase